MSIESCIRQGLHIETIWNQCLSTFNLILPKISVHNHGKPYA
uniref:Uncharacterized protein n=1 Tax=Rhizophora mucronata TaxID=61149 RepID=A0A2P2PC73_RHIMU